MPYRLLFRTDASQAIGTGHAMRCLALAEAIRELGDEATLVTKEMPEGIL
ncbi:UDP-2,4-diacetamido-2,4,6-trideoxy-beta-L-altropyranose hydrolase, partial [Candidatus Peribacteria bacterium]|nr:UDP-2,4-diacetamido-2,4,6-trideoxy-beta-L-altropyranose hydrolase [Candidatus Peribacteria bacterium]